jgi:hypothetical protein
MILHGSVCCPQTARVSTASGSSTASPGGPALLTRQSPVGRGELAVRRRGPSRHGGDDGLRHPACRGPGDDQQILDWPKDYLDAERLGGVDEFISWIGHQEHCVVNPAPSCKEGPIPPSGQRPACGRAENARRTGGGRRSGPGRTPGPHHHQSVLLPGWILANASLIRGWLEGSPRSLSLHPWLNLVLSFQAAPVRWS